MKKKIALWILRSFALIALIVMAFWHFDNRAAFQKVAKHQIDAHVRAELADVAKSVRAKVWPRYFEICEAHLAKQVFSYFERQTIIAGKAIVNLPQLSGKDIYKLLLAVLCEDALEQHDVATKEAADAAASSSVFKEYFGMLYNFVKTIRPSDSDIKRILAGELVVVLPSYTILKSKKPHSALQAPKPAIDVEVLLILPKQQRQEDELTIIPNECSEPLKTAPLLTITFPCVHPKECTAGLDTHQITYQECPHCGYVAVRGDGNETPMRYDKHPLFEDAMQTLANIISGFTPEFDGKRVTITYQSTVWVIKIYVAKKLSSSAGLAEILLETIRQEKSKNVSFDTVQLDIQVSERM